MRRSLLPVLIVLGCVRGGTINWEVQVDPAGLDVVSTGQGDVPSLEGSYLCTSPGMPALPGIPLSFVLPPGAVLDSVSVSVLSSVPLEVYDDPAIVQVLGDEDRYAAPSEGSIFEVPVVSPPVTGSMSGYTMAMFAFLPVQPRSTTSGPYLITSAELVLHYSEAGRARPLPTLTPRQSECAMTAVLAMVENPYMAGAWSPPAGDDPRDMISWVAIADGSLETALQPLIDHRNSLGESAGFLSVEWIESNYTGWDTQEKIRNCLKDLYWNSGLVYALIVSESDQTARISSFIWIGQSPMNTFTDLYYSDLDGSWDANGNHLYGEYDDDLDYFADIHVGRFPSDDPDEVDVMVSRTIAYESDPPDGVWRRNVVLAGAGLSPGLSVWGSTICLAVWESFQADWVGLHWFEDSTGVQPAHPGPLIEPLETGCAYLEIASHGDPVLANWFYPPDNLLYQPEAELLQNGGMSPIVHSLACGVGDMAVDCLAEALMTAPDGGAVAVMMNSNSGLLFFEGQGPSELMDVFYPEMLVQQQIEMLGLAHSLSRHKLIAVQGLSYSARWVLQELNFFGDPATCLVDGPTGIENPGSGAFLETASVSVEPNPTSGACTISWSTPPGSGKVTLVLMDITGRELKSWTDLDTQQGVLSFNAADVAGEPLPAGCYALVLRCSDLTTSTLFVARPSAY